MKKKKDIFKLSMSLMMGAVVTAAGLNYTKILSPTIVYANTINITANTTDTTTQPTEKTPFLPTNASEWEALIEAAPNVTETASKIKMTNERMTEEQLNAWIADYEEMGGINSFELEIVKLINAERAKESLPPLEISRPLMMSASFKSQEMVDLRYFSHQSPVYTATWYVAKELGHKNNPHPTQDDEFTNFRVEENLHGFGGLKVIYPQDIVNDWMSSQGHRAPIMSSDTRTIGIGTAPAQSTITAIHHADGKPMNLDGVIVANFGY